MCGRYFSLNQACEVEHSVDLNGPIQSFDWHSVICRCNVYKLCTLVCSGCSGNRQRESNKHICCRVRYLTNSSFHIRNSEPKPVSYSFLSRELMSARTNQRNRSSKLFDARNQSVDVDETEESQVRVKLRRLLKKRMSESQEFSGNIENMKKTLSNLGGETKLRQEIAGKTLNPRMNLGLNMSVLEDT